MFNQDYYSEVDVDGYYNHPDHQTMLEEEWEDVDYYDTGNMPCDTYGMVACSDSCSNYARCKGWE